jgi:hypothetical protein
MTFSEKSETYLGWKSTFKDVMYEIKASPIEELDLLIRYLGKSSNRQVSSIKTSNPGNLLYYYVVGLEYHNGHKNDHSHCFGKAL